MSGYDTIFNVNTGLGINEDAIDNIEANIAIIQSNITSIEADIVTINAEITNIEANIDANVYWLDGSRPLEANMNVDNYDIYNIGNIFTNNIYLNDTLVTSTATELNYNDISTLGTVEANKTVTADSSRNVSNLNTLGVQYIQAVANDEIYPASDLVFIGTEGTVGAGINFESSLIHTPGNYDYSLTLKDDVSLAVRGTGTTELININNNDFQVKKDLTVSGNASIGGNLYVTGNAVYVNTSSLEVDDNLILIGNNNTASDITDLGWIGKYYDSGAGAVRYCAVYRDASDSEFYIYNSITGEPTTTITSGSLANFNCASIYIGTNINGVPASYYDPTSSIQSQLDDKISKTTGLTQDLPCNNYQLLGVNNITGGGVSGLSITNTGSTLLLGSDSAFGTILYNTGGLAYIYTTGASAETKLEATDSTGTVGIYNAGSKKLEVNNTEVDITNATLNLNSNNITGVNNLSGVSATLTDDLNISKAGEVSVNIQSDNSAYTKYGYGTVVETARFNVGGNSTSFIINDSSTGLSGGNNALVFTPTGVSDTNLFLYANGTGSISLNANGSEKINVNSSEIDITNATLNLNSNNISNIGTLNGVSASYFDPTSSIQTQLNSCLSTTNYTQTLGLNQDWGMNVYDNGLQGLIVKNTYVSGLADIAITAEAVTGGTDAIFTAKSGSGAFSFGLKGGTPNTFVISNQDKSLSTPILEINTSAQTIAMNDYNLTATGTEDLYMLTGGTGTVGLSGGTSGQINLATGKASTTAIDVHASDSSGGINLKVNSSTKVNVNNTTVDITNANLDLNSNDLDNAEITNPHICLERTTAQVVATSTQTLLTWDSVLLNRGFSFTPTSGIVYVPEAGLYQVEWNVIKDANATGSQFIWVNTDSTAYSNSNKRFAYHVSSTNSDSYLNGSATLNLSTGSYVVVYVFQSSGGNISYSSATAETRSVFMVTKIGKYVS